MKGKLEVEFEYESIGQVMEAVNGLDLLAAIDVKRVTAIFYDSDEKEVMMYTPGHIIDQ